MILDKSTYNHQEGKLFIFIKEILLYLLNYLAQLENLLMI